MVKKRVLFLCTGNSCRSHMAEGLVNHFLGETWEAVSAGTVPAGYVHPLAVQTMAEVGVDITRHWSKTADSFRQAPLDLVITVCDDAAENCPIWLGQGCKLHISFPDPAKASGTPEEQMAVFRQVRDTMREQLLEVISTQ